MLVRGYSKALFSTWFYVPDVRAVFDAGEGINFSLGGRLTKADVVFLTHGHSDHFTGLLNLIIARTRLGPGKSEDPMPQLTIFYPEADANLRLYLDYIQRHLEANNVPEVAVFRPVKPGEEHPMPGQRKRFIRTFPVRHGQLPSVGYIIFETRDKLRPEYEGLPPREVGQLIQGQGKEKILIPIDVSLVCYTGDSECAAEAPCDAPKLLLHEATFLTEDDRHGSFHATLAEALDSARRMQARQLLLFHFSARYFAEDIRRALSELLEATPMPGCQVGYALPGRMYVSEE